MSDLQPNQQPPTQPIPPSQQPQYQSPQQSFQPQPQYQTQYQPQQPPKGAKGKGLGIAAMVLGIVAATLSFLPFINILGIPLAIVGLILGIIALVLARGGRGPIGFGIAGAVLSLIALVITIAMYAAAAAVIADNTLIDEALVTYSELDSLAQKDAPSAPVETPTTPNSKPETPNVEPTTSASWEEWHQFLVDYEAWADAYVAFFEKYDSLTEAALSPDYSRLLNESIELQKQATEMPSDLTPEQVAESETILLRINQKLLDALL
jgi:hypothetical protein